MKFANSLINEFRKRVQKDNLSNSRLRMKVDQREIVIATKQSQFPVDQLSFSVGWVYDISTF